MISVVRSIVGAVSWVFDLVLAPLATWPAVGMILISVLTAVWVLLLFKAVTPQKRLTATRDRIFGHIYEMGLYQDHLGVLARIQGNLALANLRYLGFTLPALLVLIVPMLLTLGQLEDRYARRPLEVGENTVLVVEVTDEVRPVLQDIRLEAPAGVRITAGPVRNRSTGSLAWRLEAVADGSHALRFFNGDQQLGSQHLQVGRKLVRLYDIDDDSIRGLILHPGAPDLSDSPQLAGMTIQWPERHTRYLGLEMNWLLAFTVFSMLAGLFMKDLLKVSI